jgi:putative transposase
MHFWALGYYVSASGDDEESVCDYIKKQEKEDARLDQLQLFDDE